MRRRGAGGVRERGKGIERVLASSGSDVLPIGGRQDMAGRWHGATQLGIHHAFVAGLVMAGFILLLPLPVRKMGDGVRGGALLAEAEQQDE